MEDLTIGVVIAVVGCLGTFIGFGINFLTFQRNKGRDIREETKEGVETKAKLDYIATAVDEIRLDNKARDREVANLNSRLIRVEESAKSAHHRLNIIEGKGDMYNEKI